MKSFNRSPTATLEPGTYAHSKVRVNGADAYSTNSPAKKWVAKNNTCSKATNLHQIAYLRIRSTGRNGFDLFFATHFFAGN